MHPTNFEGATIINKPEGMTDEECSPVYATHGFDEANYPFFLTAWQPSYEDIQAINRGEPVYVKTIALQLPPMSLFTLDEKGEIN